jgi:hypothetical protein
MSVTLNKATLIGHLSKDAEIRTFQNGGRPASLSSPITFHTASVEKHRLAPRCPHRTVVRSLNKRPDVLSTHR